jgi:hypothetical protein
MELEADQIAKAKFGGLKPKPRLIVKVDCYFLFSYCNASLTARFDAERGQLPAAVWKLLLPHLQQDSSCAPPSMHVNHRAHIMFVDHQTRILFWLWATQQTDEGFPVMGYSSCCSCSLYSSGSRSACHAACRTRNASTLQTGHLQRRAKNRPKLSAWQQQWQYQMCTTTQSTQAAILNPAAEGLTCT